MTFISRLREQTADLHRAVEKRLGDADGFGSVDHLIVTLGAFYGYQSPWEAAVRPWASCPGPADADRGFRCRVDELMAPRWRAHRLEADLAHFGVSPASVPQCSGLPPMGEKGTLLGSLYVMEGSTLGGQVISRRLEQRLGLSGGLGYSYFQGEGPAIVGGWRQFLAALAELASAHGCEDDAVAGAVDTFRSLDRWFERAFGAEVPA